MTSVDMVNGMKCPVCEQAEATFIRVAFDDRYGHPDLFSIVRCKHCGHLMTAPRLHESDLAMLYSTYYPRKYVNVDELRREAAYSVSFFSRVWRWWTGTDNQGQYTVRPGELMLDIGCGSGLSLLEARALGAEVRGIEADPNVQRIAEELGLKIHIGSLLDEPFAGEQFDLVVLNQVIEHVPDPALMLDRLRSRIRPSGRLVVVFPNVQSLWCRLFGDRWINWHVPYHLHHFNRKGFERMAVRCGYQVQSVRTITPNLWTILQVRASRVCVQRGNPSPIWSAPASSTKVAAKQIQTASSSRWHTLRSIVRRMLPGKFAQATVMLPISVVNRVVDCFGLGDSLMVELKPVRSS